MKKRILVILLILFELALSGCSEKIETVPETDILPQEPPVVYEQKKTQLPASEKVSAIYINGNRLTVEQIATLTQLYGGMAPTPGNYWYDPISGLFGIMGQGTLGVTYPRMQFGMFPADASNGNTDVFVNGRELTEAEAQYLERLLNTKRIPGYYWLDTYGNFGDMRQTFAVNLYQDQQGSTIWSTELGYAGGSSDGCSYINIPSDTGVSAGFVTTGCG